MRDGEMRNGLDEDESGFPDRHLPQHIQSFLPGGYGG